MSERTVRWGGAAAILFVVLILITVFASGSPPAGDDSVEKIREYMVDNRSTLLVTNLIGLVAVPFLAWFGVVFRELVRGDRTASAFGTASLVALLLTAPMAMAGGALFSAPLYLDGATEKLGGDTLRVVYEGQTLLFGATASGIALFGLMSALAIRRTKALPAYAEWLGYLAAVGGVVGAFATLDAGAAMVGFVGLAGFSLFLLAAGITMAMGRATPAA